MARAYFRQLLRGVPTHSAYFFSFFDFHIPKSGVSSSRWTMINPIYSYHIKTFERCSAGGGKMTYLRKELAWGSGGQNLPEGDWE